MQRRGRYAADMVTVSFLALRLNLARQVSGSTARGSRTQIVSSSSGLTMLDESDQPCLGGKP